MNKTTSTHGRSQAEDLALQELYDMYRKEILEWKRSNTEAYDKGIFFVASIFLAASMALVRLDGLGHTLAMQACLVIAWALLVSAIACTLRSFVLGNRALELQMQQLEKAFLEGNREAVRAGNPFERRRERASQWGEFSLVASAIFIVLFALMNMLRGI